MRRRLAEWAARKAGDAFVNGKRSFRWWEGVTGALRGHGFRRGFERRFDVGPADPEPLFTPTNRALREFGVKPIDRHEGR